MDKQDGLAGFSGRGPRSGDFGLKPDLAAPGVDITAARADGTELGPIVDEHYVVGSGTSMAAPHVAGAAAILAQRQPDWDAARLKDALMSTATDAGYTAYEQGTGRVDVGRATTQGVYATGMVDFGARAYDETTPVTKEITYRNYTDEPVTLTLNASLRARRGEAPAEALRLDRDAVTVPAGESTVVEVTFDPSNGPESWYEGAVRADADGITLTTSVGGYRDLPRVTLTGSIIPPDGATELRWDAWLLTRIDGWDEVPATGQGPSAPEISEEIYAGHYAVRSFVVWRDHAGAPHAALVVAPDVDATGDATVRFDLRQAAQLTAATPRPTQRYVQQFGFVSTAAGGGTSVRSEVRLYGENTLWTLPTGEPPSVGEFYAYTQQVLTEPRLTMRASGSPTTLDARYSVPHVLVGDHEITRFDGDQSLPLAYADSGTALDNIDVDGKLVLLDLSDICAVTCTDYGLDRVRAAADAGAAGVVGFGSAGQGFLDPSPYESRYLWPAYPIPTVSLPADQGAQLRDALAGRDIRIRVDATAEPSYVYALSVPWVDRIPATLDTSVGNQDLYRIDNRIHADGPGTADLLWNAQLAGTAAATNRIGQGNRLRVTAPGTVTTYLGPVHPDVAWNHGANLAYDTDGSVSNFHRSGWSDHRVEEFLRPGHRTDELGEHPLVPNTNRYAPNVARYFTPTCLSCRNGDMLNPVHVLSADGRGGGYQAYDLTEGANGDPQTELRLYRDGVELPVQSGIAWIAPPFIGYPNPYFTLPPEPAGYRLTEHHQTYRKLQRYARTVDTEWTFRSQRPSTGFASPADGANCMGWFITFPYPPELCQATGQLFVGYELGLDLDNTLPAGRTHVFTINAYHNHFLDPAPRVVRLDAWMSVDDGARWSRVPVLPMGGGDYRVVAVHPRLALTTGAVSLRVQATDAAGNAVDQTVHRAYGLR